MALAMDDTMPPPTAASPGAFSVLRKRADFLRAARAKRAPCPGFLVQGRQRAPDEPADTPIRVGYTCSKKVGNAVARNRAKRRLREIARAVIPVVGRAGWDYVLIGRAGATADLPMDQLKADLEHALDRLHR
jgi:ribonuclease P protein component